MFSADEVLGSLNCSVSIFPATTKMASIGVAEVEKRVSRVVEMEAMSSTSNWKGMRPGSSVCREVRRSRRRPAAMTVLPTEWK